MTNNARGEVAVNIGGQDFVFVTTLKAMAEIEAATGKTFPVLASEMGKGISIATLLACACAFARAGGADDVSAIENSQDAIAVGEAVGKCISAASRSDKKAKN
jgi:hypothetical protein